MEGVPPHQASGPKGPSQSSSMDLPNPRNEAPEPPNSKSLKVLNKFHIYITTFADMVK